MKLKLIYQFKHDRINFVFVKVQFSSRTVLPTHLRQTLVYSTAMCQKQLVSEGNAHEERKLCSL
jgi:hypothetical protein